MSDQFLNDFIFNVVIVVDPWLSLVHPFISEAGRQLGAKTKVPSFNASELTGDLELVENSQLNGRQCG